MISILFPLLILSQKATIDRINETVILDKEKAIEISKIIINENRLAQKIDSLKTEISLLETQVRRFRENQLRSWKEIERLAAENADLRQEIFKTGRSLQKKITVLEKASFYGLASASGNLESMNSINFGFALTSNKMIYSFQVDPFLNPKISYLLGLGFKIF